MLTWQTLNRRAKSADDFDAKMIYQLLYTLTERAEYKAGKMREIFDEQVQLTLETWQ